jgi:plastocyanin
VLAGVLLAGIGYRRCGGESEGKPSGGEAPAAPAATAPEAANPAANSAGAPGKTGTGVITGVVRLTGPAPEAAPKHEVGAFAECAKGASAGDRTLQLGKDGGVRNAFIWVKSGLAPGKYPVPTEPITVDQHACEFEPRVVGVRVGQPIALVNSDAILHNVHGYLGPKTAFNVALPTKGNRAQKTFEKPEVMARLTCDVHAWMRAYAGVLDHPFFAVSDADGNFTIKNLPAGDYTLGVWHERLGGADQKVSLAEGATQTVPVPLTALPAK